MGSIIKKQILDVIRVETALSRYPIHRLAKSGKAVIVIREETPDGRIEWEVSHNSKYGQPGPLAYKLDTVIINRRIEAAGRPAPKMIRLGNFSEICRELGMADGGRNRAIVRTALLQNAFAGITAKFAYKDTTGVRRTREIATTRYSVFMYGDDLPDGHKADQVVIILNDFYREILDTAPVRPLDYGLLKRLTPAAQRLYELLSFKVYSALKNGHLKAKLSYSDLCTHAPQTRYHIREQARKQMSKLNLILRKEGYIGEFTMLDATDKDGRPDWIMEFTPGPKALSDHATFTGRKPLPENPLPPSPAVEVPNVVEPGAIPEAVPDLVAALIARGVTKKRAIELAGLDPGFIAQKIEEWDWLITKEDRRVSRSPAGYLAQSIEDAYASPEGFVSAADRDRKDQADQARKERENQERAAKVENDRKANDFDALVEAEIASMSKTEQDAVVEAELERDGPEKRAEYESLYPPNLKRVSWLTMLRRGIREGLTRDA